MVSRVMVSRAILSRPAVPTRTCEGVRGDGGVGRSVEREWAALLIRVGVWVSVGLGLG